MADDPTGNTEQEDGAAAPERVARGVMRGADRAVLSTIGAADGWPHGSLVLAALDTDVTPLLLISTLAVHTRNLAADDRVSLLFDGTAGYREPLEGPRVTVLGRAERTDSPDLRARYLARHPGSALYADFTDFSLYAVRVEAAHLVAGFGRIHRIERGGLILDPGLCTTLAAAEGGIVAHMNEDHGDALDAYANGLAGRTGTGWRMTGIDPEGIDLRREDDRVRIPFDALVTDGAQARAALVALARRARAVQPPGEAAD